MCELFETIPYAYDNSVETSANELDTMETVKAIRVQNKRREAYCGKASLAK